jgi:hypothetical protein
MERNYSNSNLESMASDSSYAQDAWLVVAYPCPPTTTIWISGASLTPTKSA